MNNSVVTNDGSASIFSTRFGEQYHSKHCAWAESMHVFIKMGLCQKRHLPKLSVFEMGFGSGLNLLLSIKHLPANCHLYYETVEKFPLQSAEYEAFATHLTSEDQAILKQLHGCDWNRTTDFSAQVQVRKIQTDICHYTPSQTFDVVYYDAFSPRAQPECWDAQIFSGLYDRLADDGILVTYCAKGSVKRLLSKIGFQVRTLPGPPYKREMIQAVK